MSSTRSVVLNDHSIASMSGSAQLLISQDGTRSFLHIFNDGADNVTVQPLAWSSTSASGGAALGGDVLVPNGSITYNTGSIPANAFEVTGTSGQPVTCWTSP